MSVSSEIRNKSTTFLQWWGNELLSFLPARARDFLLPVKTQLLIEITKVGTLKLTRITPAGREPLMTVRPRSDRADPEDENSLHELTETVDTVVIALPESAGFRRRVDLPEAARENLREVLAIEMDRLTPFRASDIYFSCSEPEAGRAKDQMSVDLTIVPKKLAHEAIRMAETLGIRADMLTLGDDVNFDHNLMDEYPQSAPRPLTPAMARALSGATALLLIAVTAIPFVKQSIVIGDLERLIESAEATSGDSSAGAQELTWQKGARQVSSFRARNASAIATLDALSKTVPKDTWLTDIEISPSERRLTLSGYSSNAAALISPLESLEGVKSVRFVEPVASDDDQSRDRFRVTADLTGVRP